MGHKPDFRTISNFRKDHLELLPCLFKQVVQIAMKLGYASHGHVSTYGSEVIAKASKHKDLITGLLL